MVEPEQKAAQPRASKNPRALSPRRLAANRNNARKSTGPRTASGKARTSRNALRHGLASISFANTEVSPQIERMAKSICDKDATPLLYEQALIIAESEVLLLRVRAARLAMLERMKKAQLSPKTETPKSPNADHPAPSQRLFEEDRQPVPRNEVEAYFCALPELTKLDGYEQRALSRRRRAIRKFDALKAELLIQRPT
jgi:hypothetical protein